MTLHITDETYCIGMWMLASNDVPIEHLITLYRQGNEPWEMLLRQRTIVDDKNFDSDDRKKTCKVTFKEQLTENAARAKAEEFIDAFAKQFDYTVDFQPIYENFIEWLDRRRTQGTLPNWMHVKQEKLDERP